MQVTREDGGRLNAFATEPRMRYAEPASATASGQRLLLIGIGVLLVVAMTFVAVSVS